jgi:membrane protein
MNAKVFLRKLKDEASADRIGDVAAMMTYYALFALFPMLIFVVTVALLVIPDGVLDQGVQMMTAAMPGQAGQLLQEQVGGMKNAAHGGFAVGSMALALWSASRGAASLSQALNDMFEKEETRPWWKRQLVALGTTLAVALLIILALALLVAGPAVGHVLADRFGLGQAFDVLWGISRWLLAGTLIMVVWALLYRWLPNTQAPLRIFTLGAFVGVVLWIGASQLFALYVSNFGKYEKTYGAMAGVIIFLTWLWLSNLSLLIGAEINDVQAELRKDKSPAAARLADEDEPKRRPPSRPPSLRPRPQHS